MNHRFLRHTLISALLLAAASPLSLLAEEAGCKSVGLRGGYNSKNESGCAGIYFQYSFSSRFRLAPDIDYVFIHHDTDAVIFDINAQFPFSLDVEQGRWQVYPLAGLSYATWSVRYYPNEDGSRSSKIRETARTNCFGFNVGGGIDWRVTPTLKLMAEGKYNWLKHHQGAAVTVGIGFIF